MKPFAIRVPEEVQKKLKEIDTNYIRKVLTEVAGMTYEEESRLILIEDIVRKYVEKNIGKIKTNEKEVINEDMTSLAINSILSIRRLASKARIHKEI